MTAKEVMSDSNSHEIKATKVSKPAKGSTIGRQKKKSKMQFLQKRVSYTVVIEIRLSFFNGIERTPSGLSMNHPMGL